MIVASQFGWGAVSGEPMTHYDLLLAAQLMAEERLGKRLRAAHNQKAAEENAAVGRTLKVVKG